jgi:hypothetical protein
MTDWRKDLQAAVDRVNEREDQRRRRRRDGRRTIATFGLACLIGGLLILADQARAAPPIPGNVFTAVRAEWPRRADRITAFRVIRCETGNTYSTTIGGSRYGLFAFGPWERSRFGYGSSARAQAHGAHRYWQRSGWYPWLHYEPPGCGT